MFLSRQWGHQRWLVAELTDWIGDQTPTIWWGDRTSACSPQQDSDDFMLNFMLNRWFVVYPQVHGEPSVSKTCSCPIKMSKKRRGIIYQPWTINTRECTSSGEQECFGMFWEYKLLGSYNPANVSHIWRSIVLNTWQVNNNLLGSIRWLQNNLFVIEKTHHTLSHCDLISSFGEPTVSRHGIILEDAIFSSQNCWLP